MSYCEPSTQFKGVGHFGEAQFLNQLEANLKCFLDWSILRIGGWTDITVPTSGAFGGDFSRLRLSNDPSYTSGKVWEGVRKDWVWETGVNYENNGTTYNPAQVTGVVINGTGYGTGHATYGFYVNYPLGRIILNTAVPKTNTVRAAYSFRNVQVYKADDAPWWREIQDESFRPDRGGFLSYTSGNWAITPSHRVQLPAIVIEAIPNSKSKGAEVGNGALDVMQDVAIHVIGEDRFTRNNILDWIRNEQAHVIWLADFNRVDRETGNPLDYRGMVRSNPNTYPALVRASGDGGYRYSDCRFDSVTLSDIQSLNPNLHIGTAVCRINTIIPVV